MIDLDELATRPPLHYPARDLWVAITQTERDDIVLELQLLRQLNVGLEADLAEARADIARCENVHGSFDDGRST